MRFADEMAARRGLAPDWVRAMIGQAAFLPNVPRLMLPPARGRTARSWRNYRSRFIDAARIRAGLRFWQANRATLARAQAQYGVPAQIIVGIIGVETIYGQNVGSHRVIDALATLTFDFPAAHPRAEARQAYFQGELETFIALAQRTGIDPRDPVGSYAGAMGLPQFMPSSWVNHAVDYDRDGRIDLWHSEADAIGSVANYFIGHGWQPGLRTHYPVRLLPGAQLPTLLAPDILPSFTPDEFVALGALALDGAATHRGKLALIELKNGDPALPGNEPTYVAGTENFYAVTRYNWSSYYAMSVIELGEEVAAEMNAPS
ncbi:MAG: lytic murein transglycosylase B [Pseudomonadota bacterium]|nr:lytic murein transglycosylase B [Pseudomonadota bacterium]